MAIQFKGSDLTGIIPAPEELDERELAINTVDGKLFTKTPGGNVIEIGADNINTGLATPGPTSGVHSGHRYINGVDDADFMALGADATDLTYSSGTVASLSIGAGGTGSFSAGIDATAGGNNTVAIGNLARSNGFNSVVIGINSTSNSVFSDMLVLGNNNDGNGTGSVTVGSNNTNGSNTLGGGVILGTGNNLTTEFDVLIGEGLSSTGLATGSTVIGRYNLVNAGTGINQFTVANGTDTTGKNILSIDTNGVLNLDSLTQITNISDDRDVLTLGFLNDNNTAGVASVNNLHGIVTLSGDNVPAGATNIWYSQAEADKITQNQTDISLRELLLPVPHIDANPALTDEGKALVVQASGSYTWQIVGASGVEIPFNGLSDTPDDYIGIAGFYPSFESDGYTPSDPSVPGSLPIVADVTSDPAIVYTELTRTSGALKLNMPQDDTSNTYNPLDPYGSGTTNWPPTQGFDLSINGGQWPVSASVQDVLNDKQTEMPGPVVNGANSNNGTLHKYILTVTDQAPSLDDPTEVTSWDITVVPDTAQNTFYSNGTSGLTASDVQDAIDEVVLTASGSTGDLTALTTTDKSSLVSAINEVDANEGATNTIATTNATNIGTLTNLTTSAQDNLVNAINEVDASVGGVSINYRNDSAGATIAPLDYSFADTVSAVFTLSLPASAGLSLGNQIIILDSTGSFSTNNLTVSPDLTDTIMGANTDFVLDVDNREYKFIWSGSDWRVI